MQKNEMIFLSRPLRNLLIPSLFNPNLIYSPAVFFSQLKKDTNGVMVKV